MVDKSLEDADLVVDEVYGGSRNGNASDDPLPSLIGVDNGAGFRHLGQRPHVSTLRLISLKTSFSDVNWPDSLDRERGSLLTTATTTEPGSYTIHRDRETSSCETSLMKRTMPSAVRTFLRSSYLAILEPTEMFDFLASPFLVLRVWEATMIW